MVRDVSATTFATDVIARSHEVPVVVDFWAAWCGPCRVLGPVLEQLAAEADGAWELVKIDTDANQALAREYRIQGIPAVKAFRDGRVVAEFVGAQSRAFVQDWLKTLGPSEADQLAQLDDEDSLRRALQLEPGHPVATRKLAALEMAAEAGDADTAALAAAVQADPADLDTRWKLAHALAAAGDHDGALGHLLELVRRDRTYRDDGARKAMLRIFDVIGVRSPLADRWRDQLARALY